MKVASLLSNFSSSSEWTSINRAKDFKTDPKLSEKTKFATKWSITLLSFARKTQNLWFCDFPAPYLKIKTKDSQLFLPCQPLSTLLSSQLTFKSLTQQSELGTRVKKISLFYFFSQLFEFSEQVANMYIITMILPVDLKNKTHFSLSSEFDFLIMYRQTFCTYVSISIVNIEIVKFMKKIISFWVSYSINILFKALHM